MGKQRQWIVVGIVTGVVVLSIALVTTILTAGSGTRTTSAIAPILSPPTATPTPTPSSSPSATPTPAPLSAAPSAGTTSTPQPWSYGRSSTPYRVDIEIIAPSRAFAWIGWEVETQPKSRSTATMDSTYWSHHLSAYSARGDVFFCFQFKPTSRPVTGRIVVDGQVESEKTLPGARGGLICLR